MEISFCDDFRSREPNNEGSTVKIHSQLLPLVVCQARNELISSNKSEQISFAPRVTLFEAFCTEQTPPNRQIFLAKLKKLRDVSVKLPSIYGIVVRCKYRWLFMDLQFDNAVIWSVQVISMRKLGQITEISIVASSRLKALKYVNSLRKQNDSVSSSIISLELDCCVSHSKRWTHCGLHFAEFHYQQRLW